MKKLLIVLLILVLTLVGCSVSIPTVEEAPYRISWEGESYGTVYCDNYELGSSVVIDGYWERSVGLFLRCHYVNRLLILDASEVTIEERRE